MSVRLEAVGLDVPDAYAAAAFWSALLGREQREEPGGVLVPGDETQVGLRFVTTDTEQQGPRQLHLHLTSRDEADQLAIVDRALALGGRHLDVGQRPEDGHLVLADPGGNELCVIEPGNNFLAGTGFLGEVTCDGTREVGLFWRDVLGWTLVWDQDGETSVQSPAGGTKVSWGGPPIEPLHGRNRQRLELRADDVEAEVARLQSLGASRLEDNDGGVLMSDPDARVLVLRAEA